MNTRPQSRPEAELPEVTDDGCVCGWGGGPHGKKDCDELPPAFATYVGTHEDEYGKVTAMVEVFGDAGGGSWSRKERPRVDDHPTQTKLRWEKTA